MPEHRAARPESPARTEPAGLTALFAESRPPRPSLTALFANSAQEEPLQPTAVLQRDAGVAERERYVPREGEAADWGPGKARIMHGLSMGHLHIEDARQLGYGRNGMEEMSDDRRDGWQTMPRDLWHTTTNVNEAIHGLKTRDEMDMRRGHGLGGGASDTISLTDSRHHAHVMLAGLREYHDVLTGKTPLHELVQRAVTGSDAEKPYGDHFRAMIGYNDHDLSSMMRGMRHEPGLRTPGQAAAEGLTPHPENHHKPTVGDMAGGWERPATPSELSNDRSEIYKAHGSARWHGGRGPRPILFLSNDPHALAQKERSDFAVLHIRSRPGAQGYRIRGEHEWRTGTGDALHVMGVDEHPDVAHDWQHFASRRSAMPSIRHPRPEGFHTTIEQMPSWANGGHRWPKHVMTGHNAEGEAVGKITYHVHPAGHAVEVHYLDTDDAHAGRGYGSAMMDDLYAAHPHALINHGERSPKGRSWWRSYEDPDPDRNVHNLAPADYRHHFDPDIVQEERDGNAGADQLDRLMGHASRRTASGKPWLPHDRYFGPGRPDLDPRLFDGEHLKPAWRKALLALAARAFAGYGPSWISWTTVYLAGSQASHWYGNNDLDVLVGINYDKFRRTQPRHRNLTDRQIDELLNADAHRLCDPARWFTIGGKHLGPFDSTLYVNADSYDIRKIKPYAAYDLTSDTWAVKPVQVPEDFGPQSLPSADFLYARSLASQVRALRKLPAGQAQALGAALYDRLHGERHDAFSDHGGGLYDVRNIAWKYLALHPEHPMEHLVAWKRAEQQPQPLSRTAFVVKAGVLQNPEAGHESNQDSQHDEWFHGAHHDFDHPRVNEASERGARGKDWNTALGTHWTSRHDVADQFGLGLPGETELMDRAEVRQRQRSARVLHARLHLANPRRYGSEFNMDREAYGHEFEAGNHPSRHDPDFLTRHEGDSWLGHEQDLRSRRDWDTHDEDDEDEHWHDEEESGSDPEQRFKIWLSHHPDRYGIAQRFKQRLIGAGHDGVIYSNEYEGGDLDAPGHTCAIAFHPHQVEVTQDHQAGWDCLDKDEAEEYRHDHRRRTAGMHGPGSDADFEKNSAMIALVPPRSLADKLVQKDGEPADQMHVTLAYIPDVGHDRGAVHRAVSAWAAKQQPIRARVQGAGTFVASPHVEHALVDLHRGSDLHSGLMAHLEASGFAPSREHGFTSHITLAYRKHHVRFIPKVTPEGWTAHHVWVCHGEDWQPVPLGGSTVQK